ncbi:MAG: hypothetical protein U5N86_07505 [Planctomycetota bacterium]|nr:hypothetical protein [Planctomycetota bacterium]
MLSAKNAFTFVNNAAQNLKPGSPAFALHASLSHIASLQKAPGFFSVSDNDERFVSDIVTGLPIAALAKAGNTLERGPHSDKVAKAFKWITETMDERGIISSSMQSTPQIFLTFGLAELYAESGDPRVRKPLGLALERLFSLQLEDGTYGRSVSGQEGIADAAIATITFRIAWDAGAPFPGNATRAFDKAHDLAMGRLKVTEGELLDSRGMPVRAGTAQEVLNYGSVLALLKSSGKQFPSGNSMKFLLHCRELKHSSNAISPEGWMLNAWMWKHFGLGQWQFLYDSIRGGRSRFCQVQSLRPVLFQLSHPSQRTLAQRPHGRSRGDACPHADVRSRSPITIDTAQ